MASLDRVTGHAGAPEAERGPMLDAPLDPELEARLEAVVGEFIAEAGRRPGAAGAAGADASEAALGAAVAPLFDRLFATATAWARERPELLGQRVANGPAVDVRAILDFDEDDALGEDGEALEAPSPREADDR